MILQEAIRTGMRFKRRRDTSWYHNDGPDALVLHHEDILSNDWEVEGKHTKLVDAMDVRGVLAEVNCSIEVQDCILTKLGLI